MKGNGQMPNIYGRKVTDIYVDGQYEAAAESKRSARKAAQKLRVQGKTVHL